MKNLIYSIILFHLFNNGYSQELMIHNRSFVYLDSQMSTVNEQYLEFDTIVTNIYTSEEYRYNKSIISIKNNTNEKLYFLIVPKFSLSEYETKISNASLSFLELEDIFRFKLKILNKEKIDSSEFCLTHNDIYNTDLLSRNKSDLEFKDYQKLSDSDKNKIIDSLELILLPHEIRYFIIYFSLPEYNYDEFDSIVECNYVDNKENNFIQMDFNQNKEHIKSILTKRKIKELKKNNIKIFHGTIKSNKVPLLIKEEQ